MNAEYVNYICETINWFDALDSEFSSIRLQLLVFTEMPNPPKWIVEQTRMTFRETERTLDMDWALRVQKMILISKCKG